MLTPAFQREGAGLYEHGVNHPLGAIHYKEKKNAENRDVVVRDDDVLGPGCAGVCADGRRRGWRDQLGGNHFWFRDRHRCWVGGAGPGRAASAACEALGRNPAARAGIQVALILGLAFIESLVLFTLVIIFVKVA